MQDAADGKDKELVLVTKGPAPGGGTGKFRERYEFKSTDAILIVAELWQDGKWVRFMTTNMTRKKENAAK